VPGWSSAGVFFRWVVQTARFQLLALSDPCSNALCTALTRRFRNR